MSHSTTHEPESSPRRAVSLATLAVAALGLAGMALAFVLRDEQAGAVDVPVAASNFVFTPKEVNLDPGDRVAFSNAIGFHEVAFTDFDTPVIDLGAGDSGTTNAFTVVGTFYFYCIVHADGLGNENGYNSGAMVGRVIVVGGGLPATNTPTSTPTGEPTPVDTPIPTSTAVRGDESANVPGVARE